MATNELAGCDAGAVLDSLSEAVYVVDRDRRIMLWNSAAEGLTGFGADDVLGRSCFDRILNHVNDAGTPLCGSGCPLLATIEDGEPRRAEVYLRHRDGHRQPVVIEATPLRDETGTIIGATEVFRDNSEMLITRRHLRDLESQALTDPLTGLANRRHVEAELGRALAERERYGTRFGVLLVDLDNFKRVNDGFGHGVGDRALQMVASTLAYGCRASDLVGRWGGEEFVVITRAGDHDALVATAERLRRLVAACRLDLDLDLGAEAPTTTVAGIDPARPVSVGVTISVGASAATSGDGLDDLLGRADAALYEAKSAGRNRVRVTGPVDVVDIAELDATRGPQVAARRSADGVAVDLPALHRAGAPPLTTAADAHPL